MTRPQSPPKNTPVSIGLAELIDQESRLRRLPKTPPRRLTGQQGGYRSRFYGRGMEFAEVRGYLPGDDVRNIDWRVTARRGKVHTKLFHEERDRPVVIGVDYRRPMFFATRGRFKAVQASLLAALFAWQALQHKDRVGGFIFSEEETHDLRPRYGRKAVLQFFQQMVQDPAWDRPPHQPFTPRQPLAERLESFRRVARPGSLVLLLSDFSQWDTGVEKQLSLLRRHCDIGLVHFFDPLEAELPPAGRYRLSDGAREIDIETTEPEARLAYRRHFAERRQQLQTFCRTRSCRLISLSTAADPLEGLFAIGGT